VKRLLLIIVLVAAGGSWLQSEGPSVFRGGGAGGAGDQVLAGAYQARRSDVQVAGEGVVVKILADDLDGSRHQRFVLRLQNGQTLLLSHNIDLAPRVDALAVGDRVTFYGEYEWNPKGGVIH
jgi:hypothetical protein